MSVVPFPVAPAAPVGDFDPHAWIRAVEAAGGELRMRDNEAWSIVAAGEEDGSYVPALCDLLAQTGGPSPEARARRVAVYRALCWRAG